MLVARDVDVGHRDALRLVEHALCGVLEHRGGRLALADLTLVFLGAGVVDIVDRGRVEQRLRQAGIVQRVDREAGGAPAVGADAARGEPRPAWAGRGNAAGWSLDG